MIKKISPIKKSILESLSLYMQQHTNHSDELITSLTIELTNKNFVQSLIEQDRVLLNATIKITIAYCIAYHTLNKYPTFIKSNAVLVVFNLLNGVLKINQRLPLAELLNNYVNDLQLITSNDEQALKIEILLKMFDLEFNINEFYDVAINIHNQKLLELEVAHNVTY